MNQINRTQKPPWLKVRLPAGEKYAWIRKQSQELKLATVCEEARCPNIGECWSSGTATFMIMGDTCTRGCKFCNVKTDKAPPPLDCNEPAKLAATINKMGLSYIVLTSVDRDDLADQGSNHVAACISAVKSSNPELLVEMLMPDFQGKPDLIDHVALSQPHVLAHNIETVERLTRKVRDRRAGYAQSLAVLKQIKERHPSIYTKSSIMLGLGETEDEVITAFADLRKAGVDFLTIGQYLQPRTGLLNVVEYVTPAQYKKLEGIGLEHGFKYVASGPLVRSSYKAGEFFISSIIKKNLVNS